MAAILINGPCDHLKKMSIPLQQKVPYEVLKKIGPEILEEKSFRGVAGRTTTEGGWPVTTTTDDGWP